MQNNNVKAKKSFGQNFCTNPNLCKEIIEKISAKPNDVIIEIGAGTGALTKYLSTIGCKVYSFEIDQTLKDILIALGLPNVTYIWKDVMTIKDLYDFKVNADSNLFVCGNLPYYCATAIIKKFIKISPLPQKLVFVVQEEVAKRIIASPGSKEYGYLSAEIQFFATIKLGKTYAPSSFKPAPKVYSTVIELNPLDLTQQDIIVRNFALKILSSTLKNRRKYAITQLTKNPNINNILPNDFSWQHIFENLNLPLNIRGEAIVFDKLLLLAQTVINHIKNDKIKQVINT